MKYLFSLLLLFMFCTVGLVGQGDQVSLTDGEKIYLHTDRDFYIGGSEIYGKLYLTDVQTNLLGSKSQVAYVDLLNEAADVVDSKIVKLIDGVADLSFLLAPSLPGDEYILRAYTKYMQNEAEAFYFRKIIYISDYQNPKPTERSTEQSNQVMVSFFPEGGHLVDGLSSNVAVMSRDQSDQAVPAEIKILSSASESIVVQTDSRGYGRFSIVAKADERYSVMVNGIKHTEAEMPKVRTAGVALQVDVNEDHATIRVSKTASPRTAGELICIIHTMNQVIKEEVIEDQEKASLDIPLAQLAMGINHITIFNQQAEVLSERLIFNHQGVSGYNVDLNLDQETYGKRDLVELEIDAYDDDGEPLISNLSLSVIDRYMTYDNPNNHDIRSYMWLGSELRGRIEKPRSYLYDLEDPDIEGIDLLMMTHGWRGIKEQQDASLMEAETGLSIRGTVHKKDKPDKPVKAIGNLTVMDDRFEIHNFETDESGQFVLQGLTLRDSVSLIFQAAVAKKKSKPRDPDDTALKGNRNVDIVIHEREVPQRSLVDMQALNAAAFYNDLEVDAASIVRFNEININTGDASIAMSVELDEFEVRAERAEEVVAYHEDVMQYTQPNARIFADDMPLLESYFDIYGMIRGRIPGLKFEAPLSPEDGKHRLIFRGERSFKLARGARFMINGSFVSVGLAEAIRPTQVAFIDAVSSLSQLTAYGGAGANGIIMIYLKPPGSQQDQTTETYNGILNYIYQGYDTVRQFYVPNYSIENDETLRDDRMTLHWEPEIITDEDGIAYVRFYTGDRNTIYEVELQGLTIDGLPVTARTSFFVNE